jgi:DNA-binding LytR/AlgR family response regulator
MSWTGKDTASEEGHCSVGVNSPVTCWYLPEGSSAWGFECWVLTQNPGDNVAHESLTYMIEGQNVLKPPKLLELLTRIEKVVESAGEEAGAGRLEKEGGLDRLAIRHGTETTFVLLESVCFLGANGRYCFAHTRNEKFLVNYSIYQLEERLDGRREFLRIHRSHILNIDYIHKVIKDERTG